MTMIENGKKNKALLVIFALALLAVALFPWRRIPGLMAQGADPAAATPINISHSGSDSGFPIVGVDANNAAYVLWIEFLGQRTFTFATNKSGAWSTPGAFEHVVYEAEEAGFPDFAVSSGGQAHVSWQDGRVTSYDIFHISYNNGWSATTNVSDANAGGSAYSGCAVNPVDNFAYVVWQDGTGRDVDWNILLRYRSPAGAWAAMQVLPVGTGYMPKIAFDATGTAHLTWMTRGSATSTVWYSKNRTPQNPSGWTQPIVIEGDTGQDWCYPRVDADKAGNAYFIWLSLAQGADAIVLRKVSAAGVLSDKLLASTAGVTAADGALAVNKTSGQAYVAWAQGGEILVNSYGTVWSGAQNMTNTAASDVQPSIAVDASGNLHLVYAELVGGNWEIMYLGTSGGAPPPVVKPKPPLALALDTSLDDTQTQKINTLSWARNPDNSSLTIQSYKVFRKTGSQDFGLVGIVSGNTFSYQDNGLPLSQKYSYALTTVSSDAQESDLSDPAVEVSTFQPLGPDCKTVTNSALFRKEKINVISWNRNPLNGAITILQYNIYRKLSTQSDSQYQKIASVGSGVLEYMDRKLSTSDTLYYYITTVDTGNTESKPSAVAKEGT
jgi:hypothetical protein